MEPLTVFIAILGCADDGSACRQQRIDPVRFASVAACRAAAPQVLARQNVDYPVIVADCRRAGSSAARRKGLTQVADARLPTR